MPATVFLHVHAAVDRNGRAGHIGSTIAGQEGVYRLITTILDPAAAPAAELAALYAQRWEFESTLDEIKTHLGGSHLVLRSQHPDGAEQELYGFLLGRI